MTSRQMDVKPEQLSGRRLSLLGAGLAGLLTLLATATGCDDQVRHDIRQGAYDVFSAGLDTLSSELTSGVTTGLSDFGSQVFSDSAGKSTGP